MIRLPRRRRRLQQIVLGITAAVCYTGLASGGRARAQGSGAFVFAWAAPAGCPSQWQVESEIARLLGGDLRLRDGGDLRAEVSVSGGPPWSADLTTLRDGRVGRRRLESPSCQAAAEAVALIIALSIDPDAAAAGAQAPSQVAQPPARKPRALRVLAGVHAQARVGTLPGTDVGAGLGVGLAGVRWHAELRWTQGLRRDQAAMLPSGAAGRFNLDGGSLTGCVDLGRGRLVFGPCATGEAGRVSATGYGATAGFSKNAPWLALGGGVFASLMLAQHIRASLELDALAPLYRPAYVFDQIPGVVFEAPPLGGRALFDLSWQF